MNYLKITTTVFLLTTSMLFSQDNCDTFYPFSEGAHFEYTTYDKKDKPVAFTENDILKVTSNSGTKTATLQSKLKDEKGKIIVDSQYNVVCSGDKVSIDYKSLLSPQVMEQFKDMDYDITGTNLEVPTTLSVGQSLPDANMTLKINMGGMNMNMNVTIEDRKVEGKETVTTPAGTFNCYIISYTTNVKMGMKQSGTSKQWIAEGVGMVKQEDYNKNGKITSSSMLTGFSK